MSSKESEDNFIVFTSHRQSRTIINITKHVKQVEESVDKKVLLLEHSPSLTRNNEETRNQHRLHARSMFHQNITMKNDDFHVAASEATVLSSEADEKLNRHVLKIGLVEASSNLKSANKSFSQKYSSTMSFNQEQSICSSEIKPYDGNLSDDQKLVLSVSDGGASKCAMKNKKQMKLLNGNVKGTLTSGKCSPFDDHLDSGTCSDAEVVSCQPSSQSPQPPPVPQKGARSLRHHVLSDSFSSDASSASSTDSVQLSSSGNHLVSPDLIRSIDEQHRSALLPSSLLIDIRNHPVTLSGEDDQDKLSNDEQESNYDDLGLSASDSVSENLMMDFYSGDDYLKFHINEHLSYDLDACKVMIHDESDESFAGIKDLRSGTSTIRSAKGTIRGVKNRVRNGIATFLQMQQTTVKVINCTQVEIQQVEVSKEKKRKKNFYNLKNCKKKSS